MSINVLHLLVKLNWKDKPILVLYQNVWPICALTLIIQYSDDWDIGYDLDRKIINQS